MCVMHQDMHIFNGNYMQNKRGGGGGDLVSTI